MRDKLSIEGSVPLVEWIDSTFGDKAQSQLMLWNSLMDINKKGTPTKQAAKCDRKIKVRINQAERTELTHPSLLTGRDPEVSAKTHKRMVRIAKERAILVWERQW